MIYSVDYMKVIFLVILGESFRNHHRSNVACRLPFVYDENFNTFTEFVLLKNLWCSIKWKESSLIFSQSLLTHLHGKINTLLFPVLFVMFCFDQILKNIVIWFVQDYCPPQILCITQITHPLSNLFQWIFISHTLFGLPFKWILIILTFLMNPVKFPIPNDCPSVKAQSCFLINPEKIY